MTSPATHGRVDKLHERKKKEGVIVYRDLVPLELLEDQVDQEVNNVVPEFMYTSSTLLEKEYDNFDNLIIDTMDTGGEDNEIFRASLGNDIDVKSSQANGNFSLIYKCTVCLIGASCEHGHLEPSPEDKIPVIIATILFLYTKKSL